MVLWLMAFGCQGSPKVELIPTESVVVYDSPTWHRDVAPILGFRCGACHRPDGIMASLDLTDPQVAIAARTPIVNDVVARTMPPWPADDDPACADEPRAFLHDRRLQDTEVDTIVAWAEAGGPLGDPGEAAPIVSPEVVHLDRVDRELTLSEPFETSTAAIRVDQTICFILDPELDTPRWLQGVEVRPDNDLVVHHVRLDLHPRSYATERDAIDGSLDGLWPCNGNDYGIPVGGFVPGSGPQLYPDGSGVHVGTDDVIVAAIHYHNIETPQIDQSSVEIQWTEDEPERTALIIKSNTAVTAAGGLQPGEHDDGPPRFLIPAGESAHTEYVIANVVTPPGTHLEVFSVLGHMHYIGSEFRMWVERADGSDGPCLLYIPRWDFDWQLWYEVDRSVNPGPLLYPGDRLHYTCTYDNSADNPEVDRLLEEEGLGYTEPHDIDHGAGSTDEMCNMLFGAVIVPDT